MQKSKQEFNEQFQTGGKRQSINKNGRKYNNSPWSRKAETRPGRPVQSSYPTKRAAEPAFCHLTYTNAIIFRSIISYQNPLKGP